MNQTNQDVIETIAHLYKQLFDHDGGGKMEVEMNVYKNGTKEVFVRLGCEHRFVVPWSIDPKATSHEEVSK